MLNKIDSVTQVQSKSLLSAARSSQVPTFRVLQDVDSPERVYPFSSPISRAETAKSPIRHRKDSFQPINDEMRLAIHTGDAKTYNKTVRGSMESLKPATGNPISLPGQRSNASLVSTNLTVTKNLMSAPKTATGSTRQLMYRLLDQATSQPNLNKEITQSNTLRSSLTSLKADCRDKLNFVNIECPKVWDHRKLMKQRIHQYTRKSIDFKALQISQEKDQVRESTMMKTQKLSQRVTSEITSLDRERKMK